MKRIGEEEDGKVTEKGLCLCAIGLRLFPLNVEFCAFEFKSLFRSLLTHFPDMSRATVS